MKENYDQNDDQSLKQAYRTAYLIAGFIRQTLTEEEHDELDDWVAASDDNYRLFDELTDEKNLSKALDWYEKLKKEQALKKTKQRLSFNRPKSGKLFSKFWHYAVAASVVIAVGLTIYFSSNKSEKPKIANNVRQDIMPGANKATLTLDNGKVILLDSEGTDTTLENGIKILRQNGEVVYNATGTGAGNDLVYNTLSIPRKGQYKLVLPDGSKVWLNAESSIKYPVAFTGNERNVFVTGETYFEVAKDVQKPFRVSFNDMEVEVLGTHFNINAYNDEPSLNTTLLEGSVKFSKGSISRILKPGQQLQLNNDEIKVINVDTSAVVAWKNKEFKFVNAPIEVVMRQVERWYDAKIIYKDKVTFHFNATIDRSEPVSKLLHFLQETGEVNFQIEDNKIIVMK